MQTDRWDQRTAFFPSSQQQRYNVCPCRDLLNFVNIYNNVFAKVFCVRIILFHQKELAEFLTVDALKIKEMPVKQSLVSGRSVPVNVTFSIALWFYLGQVILHFQHTTTHTANLQLLPRTPKWTPASVMWDVIWKHRLMLCEHTVNLEDLSSVFKLGSSAVESAITCALLPNFISSHWLNTC